MHSLAIRTSFLCSSCSSGQWHERGNVFGVVRVTSALGSAVASRSLVRSNHLLPWSLAARNRGPSTVGTLIVFLTHSRDRSCLCRLWCVAVRLERPVSYSPKLQSPVVSSASTIHQTSNAKLEEVTATDRLARSLGRGRLLHPSNKSIRDCIEDISLTRNGLGSMLYNSAGNLVAKALYRY